MLIWHWLNNAWPNWAGNLSTATSITTLGLFAGLYKKFNCQSSKKVTGERCWRIATHPVPGTSYRTCHHHMDHAEALRADHAVKRPRAHAHLLATSSASNADI